ncbi:MAG TPA: sigma-70 family RNA polymerase sigma factor [Planctomycetota bacterium]|nr:sigma-70 family RNA polymerase sigma factor [Planctomycetota bacterium]
MRRVAQELGLDGRASRHEFSWFSDFVRAVRSAAWRRSVHKVDHEALGARSPAGEGKDMDGDLASPSDEELVGRALRGDAGAFETLVLRYQQAVFSIAYYKSRNCFDAEDLAQDIFLAAFRSLDALKDPRSFASWLFGIAYNRCHKWYDRERKKVIKFEEIRQRHEREARLAWRAAVDGPVPPERTEDRLEEYLRTLPDDAREVLRLKYLEGMSYEEIEKRLGLKPHRIDYLIRRSKKALRDAQDRREARQNGM